MTISKMQNFIKKMQNNIKILFFVCCFYANGTTFGRDYISSKNYHKMTKQLKNSVQKNAILFPLPVDMIDFSSITVSVSVQKNTP